MKRFLPILLMLAAALPASAQQAVPPLGVPEPAAAAVPLPDIEFAADLHMDSLSFASAPRARVGLTGGPQFQARHDIDRGTLPEPVRAGATYRDVNVRTTISVTLLDPAASTAAPVPPNPEDAP